VLLVFLGLDAEFGDRRDWTDQVDAFRQRLTGHASEDADDPDVACADARGGRQREYRNDDEQNEHSGAAKECSATGCMFDRERFAHVVSSAFSSRFRASRS